MTDFIDQLPLLPVSIDLQNFDYFVEKEEFKKELAKNDDEFCCGLIKQYARRIQFMEKELLAMEEIEDGKIIVTIKKSDLYLCCFAGFASMKWDIYRIAKGVPSMRIRSLLKQLIIYAFPERKDLIQLSEAEIFKAVAAIPSHEFTEDNIFVAWFYARWILHLDRISRFPSITVKQTVANPAIQPDAVLLMAEQHGLCVQTTRPLTSIAAKFLQQLESLPVDRIRIPTVECFLYKNYMKENLNVWEENIEPNFQQSDLFISMEWVIHKTRYDLFHANYAAAQFRTSKSLLKLLLDAKPDFSSLPSELQDYIYYDYDNLQNFASCLGMKEIEQPKIAETKITLACAPSSTENQAKEIACGGVVSREMILNAETKKQSIMALETLKEKTEDPIERLRIEMSLFCIKETSSAVVDRVAEKIPVPSEDHFNKFVVSDPSLFAQYSTIKPDLFEHSYEQNKVKYPPKFPERYEYSEEVADFITRACPRESQPLFFLLMGKARQLENVSLYKCWEKIIDYFLSIVAKHLTSSSPQFKEISSTLVFEALNVKLHPAYTTIFFRNISLIEQLTPKFERLLQTSTKHMIKYCRFHLPALLNVGHFDSILKCISYVKDDVCYKFYVSFLNLLSHLNDAHSMSAKKDFFEQYVIILKLFTNEGSSRKLPFSAKDFLDMIYNICEPTAIKQILNYTLQIYNRWFLKYEKVHILLPIAEMKSCFILPDSYKIDPSDTRFDNHWGPKREIIYQILDACLKVSNRICSNDAFVLRATGDYTFVINNYDAALRFYLNCILVLTNYLSHPLTYNNITLIDDLFWKKIVTCLMELKRPTEAAITCQLITNMFEILPHIHAILFSVECEDATSQYFHLIGDLAIFEAMSAAYIRQGFVKLHQRLLESVLSRAFHANGPKALHNHEVLRRKSHWIQVLCSEVFDSFDTL